jgi:hypothetical protein
MATDPPSIEAGGLLQWMKLNLAVITFVFGTLTALGSALFTGVLRVSEVTHDIADLNRANTETKLSIAGLHNDMVSVDQRLNAGVAGTTAVQRECETHEALLAQRIAVLEAQMQFLAARSVTPALKPR